MAKTKKTLLQIHNYHDEYTIKVIMNKKSIEDNFNFTMNDKIRSTIISTLQNEINEREKVRFFTYKLTYINYLASSNNRI